LLALRIANPLQNDLFGRLSTDATEFDLLQRRFDEILEF